MEKNAAPKSYKDPALNKIIQEKAAWNRQVSAFINDLIHFKKSMNGWPSKFYKERSRLTQPARIDFAAILSNMTGEFSELANQSNSIVKEQADFAKNYTNRKSNQTLDRLERTQGPENAPKPTAPTGAPDLTQQLSKASDDSYYLISEGSNFITRFFSRILSPGIGFTEAARIRKLRVTLLNAAAKITKDLRAFQREIVPVFSGPASIKSASLMLGNVERNLIFLMSGLKSYKDALPQGAVDTGGRIPPPASKGDKEDKPKAKEDPAPPSPPPDTTPLDPRIERAAEVVKDISTHRNSFPGVAGMRDLFNEARKYTAASDEEKLAQADTLILLHRNLVNQICFDRNIQPPQTTLGGIVALGTKSAASADAELQVVAQNILGKWRHQLSLFDKTSSFRLDVHRMAGNARKVNNRIMDQLESGLHVEELLVLIAELDDEIKKIREAMTSLGATTRGVGFQPQFMNMLQSGRLGDHAVNLNPQQKTRLERLLERKQNTELMKMYGG